MNRVISRGAGLAACSAFLFSFGFPLRAHDPITTKLTWTQEISRIVYKRCVSCHKPGGAAFSLVSYEEARPWAKAIRDEVTTRRMPPWGAVKGIGDFLGDPSLSSPEIDMLVAWVEGGAPEGDPIYLPRRVPEPAPVIPVPAHSGTLAVRGEKTLTHAATIVSLSPQNLAPGESLEAWAVKPDGSVERFIWLVDYQAASKKDFILRNPVALTPGTRIKVETKTDASMLFLLR